MLPDGLLCFTATSIKLIARYFVYQFFLRSFYAITYISWATVGSPVEMDTMREAVTKRKLRVAGLLGR